VESLHIDSKSARHDWVLMHALAAWSLISIAHAIVFSSVYPTPNNPDAAWFAGIGPLELALRITVGLGAIAAVWLWLRMTGDYLRKRPTNRGVAWGVAIFVGLYLGAVAYFWWVWRPNRLPKQPIDAA
jgi:hypothetical protein